MSTEGDESLYKTADYFYEKMNRGYNKYINSRKQNLAKQIDLINYLDSFDKIDNNKYLNKIKVNKNKPILLNSVRKDIFDYKKSKTSNNSKNSTNNNSQNYKIKYFNTHINLSSNSNKNEKNNGQINLKSSFNSSNLKKNFIFNNRFDETKKNIRYDSFFDSQKSNSTKLDNTNSKFLKSKLLESPFALSSSLENKKRYYFPKFNNIKINNTFNKPKTKINKTKKILNPFKYSNNYKQNCILKNILKHPNLKLLYDTNEKRAKMNVKSQSESNKKKLSLLKYQHNLIKNTFLPLDGGEKRKLLESFNKINLSVNDKKKIDLFGYLMEIQKKEKELIQEHNEIEEIYDKNIEKIGFTPTGKRKIHIGKMKFKDIFHKNKEYFK